MDGLLPDGPSTSGRGTLPPGALGLDSTGTATRGAAVAVFVGAVFAGAVFAGAVFAGAVFADPGARDGTGWTVCAWARRLGKKPTSSSGMNSRRIATHGIAKQPRGAGSESQDP